MPVTEKPVTEKQQQERKTQAPRSSGLWRAMKWVVVPLVLIGLAVGGFLYWSYSSVHESTDDAQIDGHIYPVGAMVDGTVTEVLVDNNQYVEKGAILARIDAAPFQAVLDKARGDLGEAVAVAKQNRAGVPIVSANTSTQLTGAESAVVEQNAKIATAQREVEAATARLTTAEAREREVRANAGKAASDLERMKPLVAKEEISRQQYDAVVSADSAAKAATDSAAGQVHEARQGVMVAEAKLAQERAHMTEVRANVDAAKTGPQQVAASQARVESAGAQIQQKEAALRSAQIMLDYTVIRAPVSGMVSQRSVQPGQTVTRGQNLISVVPLDDLWVTANFKESQLANMRAGQPVEIEVDAYGGKKFTGKVDSIAAATGARFSLLPPENATGNYVKVVQRLPVKIVFDKGQDPDHRLRPGMSVSPTVTTK
jgi:membrane fusion protein (multidrug efflux system)